MRKVLALLLAVLMVFSMAACGKKATEPENEPDKVPLIKEPEEPVDPEPSQGLDAYDNPSDHPHEGNDLTIYDGIYRAKQPHGEDDETWLQITGFNDFIMLEYHGMMEGSVYRYWAEEFWSGEGWYTEIGRQTVSGKSQSFNSMGQYENYSELPQKRTITLAEDGVMLNEERYIRDDGFAGGHAAPEVMRERFDEDVHLDFDFQYDAKDAVGTWGFWDGWQAGCLTLAEDGTFSLFWKIPNKPIEVYKGAYGFGTNSGNLVIHAERLGYGGYPYVADWEWHVDDWGLNLSDEAGVLLDGMWTLWPIEEEFFTVLQDIRN